MIKELQVHNMKLPCSTKKHQNMAKIAPPESIHKMFVTIELSYIIKTRGSKAQGQRMKKSLNTQSHYTTRLEQLEVFFKKLNRCKNKFLEYKKVKNFKNQIISYDTIQFLKSRSFNFFFNINSFSYVHVVRLPDK